MKSPHPILLIHTEYKSVLHILERQVINNSSVVNLFSSLETLTHSVQFNLGKIQVNLILLHFPRTKFDGFLCHGIIVKVIKLTVHELRNALVLKKYVHSDIPKVGCPKTAS